MLIGKDGSWDRSSNLAMIQENPLGNLVGLCFGGFFSVFSLIFLEKLLVLKDHICLYSQISVGGNGSSAVYCVFHLQISTRCGFFLFLFFFRDTHFLMGLIVKHTLIGPRLAAT